MRTSRPRCLPTVPVSRAARPAVSVMPVHELSLALEIGRLAEARLGASVSRCVAVGVEVGAESGVEPSALAFCLEAILGDPPWTGARPVLLPAAGDILQLAWLEIKDDDGPTH